MQRMLWQGIVPLLLVLSSLFMPTSVQALGNNWAHGTLRRDLPTIHNAKRYSMRIMTTQLPTRGSTDTFTTAWLCGQTVTPMILKAFRKLV
jgi:hypothetical protein